VGNIASGQKHDPDTSVKAIPSRIAPILVIAALSLLILLVFRQVGGYSFINYDDGVYVYENPHVRGGLSKEGVSWAFTTFDAANWHPLTWLSHMADVQLFGLDAGWHHRVNVLFHLANTALLFLVLWRMTGGLWQSAFVGALFAVHPLHVQSVAWIAERKDVLSTLFWLLAMGAYLGYVRRPGIGRYLSVVAFLALGLMCKPMLVTLPIVLLLLDWWPLRRMSQEGSPVSEQCRFSMPMVFRRIWEKTPLLGLSAISCIITYVAQGKGKAISSLEVVPLGYRVSNALVSYLAYLWKAVWPASLAIFYPHPASLQADFPAWEIAGAVLFLGGVSFIVLREGGRRPYLAVGWLWYLGTLVPVIGLVQVGSAALADRYTYVPLIGVFIALTWGISELLSGWRWRRFVLWVSGGAIVVALSAAAWIQAGYWRDNVTLYSRAAAVTEKNWMALTSLGVAYEESGKPQEAVKCYQEALRIKPEYAHAWYNLGVASGKLGRDQESLGYYREVLRIDPKYVDAWYNLGLACAKLGKLQEAVDSFRETVRIKPEYALAWYNLGIASAKLGQFQEAIVSFQDALRIQPGYAGASYNLGVAYGKLGRFREAVASFQETVRVMPEYAEAWNNLGLAYEELGQFQQAVACYTEAQRIRRKQVEAPP
jgi:protein O-mannosyl-transferase